MNKEERARAKKLGVLFRQCVESSLQKVILKVVLAVIAVFYILLLFVGIGNYAFAFHIIFSSVFLLMCTSDNVGDGGLRADNYNLLGVHMGAMYTGSFLCTLPFKAKDVTAMRLRNFEINISVITAIAVGIKSVLILTENEQLIQSGFCTAVFILMEIGYAVLIFIRKYRTKFYAELAVMWVIMVPALTGFDTDLLYTTNPIIEAFGFLSGWFGTAILAVSPVTVSAAAELYLKNKKDCSWNLG